MLTSDAAGLATWEPLPAVAAAGGWVDDGTVVRLDSGSDRVGIGITSPPAPLAKLHVVTSDLDVFAIRGDGNAVGVVGIGDTGVVGTGGGDGAGVRGDNTTGVGVEGRSDSGDLFRGTDTNPGFAPVIRFKVDNAGNVEADGSISGNSTTTSPALIGINTSPAANPGLGVSGFSANGNGVGAGSANGVGISATSTNGDPIRGNGGGGLVFKVTNLGEAQAANGHTALSDERLKTNVEPLTNVLEKLKQVRGVSYERIDLDDSGRQIGVIAQELEAVFPELVGTFGDEGYKTVAYGNLTAVFIEAVKELNAENQDLRARVEALEQEAGIDGSSVEPMSSGLSRVWLVLAGMALSGLVLGGVVTTVRWTRK